MSIKIGDVEVGKEIIELRHQLIRTQKILEVLINNNISFIQPTQEQMMHIESESIEELTKLYPNMVSKQD